ncbi:uncharacterized protein cubi_00777 [Cryptosporidium ubiquitum]|uniref:Uncharacterized protein n=1 Tax=Cryptosporidium ubiquitum TaxID=857276 RepID=A0A1J4MBN0_9CRYT|nr:uncharacterized protein cubi_00777 [Cryptosporidium ubiquitum]OII71399.1 hypothetical protein cubi_00777 [Cryptosporidium ubiquitum]
MILKQGTLTMFIYIFIVFQNCIYTKFVNANSVGKLGYYDYDEGNVRNRNISGGFKKNFEPLKNNFIKFFLNDESEANSETIYHTSANTPFMDFSHGSLIKKVVPKSEKVCSSIQLMSFWRLYSDVIDLVESELINTFNSNLVHKTIPRELCENNQALTQSEGISEDISEKLKTTQFSFNSTKNHFSSLSRTNSDQLKNVTENSLRFKKDTNKVKEKSSQTESNRTNNKRQRRSHNNKKSTFQFGVHKYFHIN